MRNNFYSQRGFTVVEMLLALVIFSIVSTTLYTVFANSILIQERTKSVENVVRELNWTLHQITLDLENAIFYDFTGSYPERLSFEGKSNAIKFIVAKDGDLKEVSYTSKESYIEHKTIEVNNERLYGQSYSYNNDKIEPLVTLFREERLLADVLRGKPDDHLVQEVMCTGLKGDVKWHYSFNNIQQEPIWMQDWQKRFLPRAVRVEFNYLIDEEWIPLGRTMILPMHDYSQFLVKETVFEE